MTDVEKLIGISDELGELSRLHLAYENACADDLYGDDAIEASMELSAAVGRFLVSRGWEGKI